jgi:hypothetical protein
MTSEVESEGEVEGKSKRRMVVGKWWAEGYGLCMVGGELRAIELCQ